MSIDRCPACDYKFTWREKNGYLNASKTPRPCPACQALLVIDGGTRKALKAGHWLSLTSLIIWMLNWRLAHRLSSQWFVTIAALASLLYLSGLVTLMSVSSSKRLEVVERNIPPTALKIVTPHDGREASGDDIATPD